MYDMHVCQIQTYMSNIYKIHNSHTSTHTHTHIHRFKIIAFFLSQYINLEWHLKAAHSVSVCFQLQWELVIFL
uniref:Uncharacterized protein n=1 Tax=Anguilla anguilla TaxID=7936 RepID=A0A0E9RGI1_ANGAN